MTKPTVEGLYLKLGSGETANHKPVYPLSGGDPETLETTQRP